MSDLVRRLRGLQGIATTIYDYNTLREAADRLEKLERVAEAGQGYLTGGVCCFPALQAALAALDAEGGGT